MRLADLPTYRIAEAPVSTDEGLWTCDHEQEAGPEVKVRFGMCSMAILLHTVRGLTTQAKLIVEGCGRYWEERLHCGAVT